MKQLKWVIVIIPLIILQSVLLLHCTKPTEPEKENLPLLRTGNGGRLHKLSYVKKTDYQVFDSFVKMSENEFRLVGLLEEYKIEHIQLFKGTNKITLSKYIFNEAKYPNYDSAFFANSHLYDMNFRNSRVVTEDSIVGEYYNTHYYNSMERKAVPDSGIFAIKILQ
jgi:hypothetical protein